MVDINLLPWREYARMRMQARCRVLAGIVILLLLIFAGLYFFFQRAPVNISQPVAIVPITHDESFLQLKKIKYIGYFQRNHHLSGIILLPGGKTLSVETGSQVPGNSQVKSITPSTILLTYHSATLKISRSHS
jgi:uncharacterized SAM-binding protein YcdF (DUF218 family)